MDGMLGVCCSTGYANKWVRILTILGTERQTPVNLGTCLRCQETTDGTHGTETNISEVPRISI